METRCRYCDQALRHIAGKRKKQYCNDDCRMAYYRDNPEAVNRKTETTVCGNCGQAFESQKSAGRIYCSHACYIETRFRKKELSNSRCEQKKPEIRELSTAANPQDMALTVEGRFLSGDVGIFVGAGDFPEPVRIWLICGATWFSGKIDHFAANIPPEFIERINEGEGFVFCNRRRDLLSLLQWQGDGFALYYKRLEYGQYPWPKIRKGTKIIEIAPRDFQLLLLFPDFLSRCERGDFSPLATAEGPSADMLY